MACLIIKSGGVLAADMGLGKTLMAMVKAEAWRRLGETDGNALFIVPQDLIPQWRREAKRYFGRELTHITTRAQARTIAASIKDDPFHLPTWYISHYEALSQAGTRGSAEVIVENPVTKKAEKKTVKAAQGKVLLPKRDVKKSTEMVDVPGHWEGYNHVAAKQIAREITLTTTDVCPKCGADTDSGWDGVRCGDRSFRADMNRKAWREKKPGQPIGGGCGYVHAALRLKPMAHDLSTAFKQGCIIVDEATKIKGDDSAMSLSVRGLRARRKVLMSGTPQKNYVHDMFWLLGWALGFNTARFPFDYEAGKNKFVKDFCVTEQFQPKGRIKILPEVTNLSVLWKLLSGGIVRRRKEDCGEELAERTFVPITVPFGTAQRTQYEAWLSGFAGWYCKTHPGADWGMTVRNSAILGQLVKLEYATTLPCADPDRSYWETEGLSNYTPKIAKALDIVGKCVEAGQQVVVGSDLMLTGKIVADALNAKGITAAHILEGSEDNAKTKGPVKRAAEVKAFQEGGTRVLCAGVQSIALGHNLDNAQVVVLLGLPWDYATLHQFIARVHRLTSQKPVTVYVILTAGSLDERKWQLLSDKEASSDLALDGELSEKRQKPISMQKILDDIIAKGVPVDSQYQTVQEADCKRVWDEASFDIPDTEGKEDSEPAQCKELTKEPQSCDNDAEEVIVCEAECDTPEPCGETAPEVRELPEPAAPFMAVRMTPGTHAALKLVTKSQLDMMDALLGQFKQEGLIG